MDCGEQFRDLYTPGAYYFTLVATGLKTPRTHSKDNDGVIVKDDEDFPETQRALWQKFKANEFVELYSGCISDNWPDFFDRDSGGVSHIM